MKKFLIVIFLLFSIFINAFSLKEYAKNHKILYKFNPDLNKLSIILNGNTFTFLINEKIYYKGINIYHLDKPVKINNDDIIISDDFLNQWEIPIGIDNIFFQSKKNKYSLTVVSQSPLNLILNKDGTYTVKCEGQIKINKNYQNAPYSGVDYIKIVENSLVIKFKGIKNLQTKKLNNKIIFSYYIEKEKTSNKNTAKTNHHIIKLDRKKIKIVIDPGHGGKDPGAIGITGVKEKHIVLSIGKKLSSKLKKMGYQVIMTRNKDVFIPLRKRTRIANNHNATLFISIHANFSYNNKSSGFEIYYLSKSASDDEARQVAAYENNVIKLEKKQSTNVLNDILWSMISNEFENESIMLAGQISKSLKKFFPPHGKPIKHARFYVLYGATMPAILIETGFLTNKNDVKKLVSYKFQDKYTSYIAQAINTYIKKNYRKFIK